MLRIQSFYLLDCFRRFTLEEFRLRQQFPLGSDEPQASGAFGSLAIRDILRNFDLLDHQLKKFTPNSLGVIPKTTYPS